MGALRTYATARTNLDGVYGADRDARDGHARENMSPYLETAHGKSALQDRFGGCPEGGETDYGAHEQEAICRYEPELDKCEGDGVAELVENDLARVR